MELPHEVWDLKKKKNERKKHQYNKKFEGETYTSITCNMLEELINDNDITNNRNRGAQVRMDRLIGSIRYSKRINDTKDEIKRKIIDKIVFTEGFSLGKEELKERMLKIRREKDFSDYAEGLKELFEDCEKNNLQIDMDTFMKLLKELNLELEEIIDEGTEADNEIEIEYEKETSEEKESSEEEELLEIDNEQEVERTLQELESINTEQKDSSVKNSESESSGK